MESPHERFRVWRAWKGHTLEAAADLIGCSPAYVSLIESGQKTPTAGRLQRAIEKVTKGMPGGAIKPEAWDEVGAVPADAA